MCCLPEKAHLPAKSGDSALEDLQTRLLNLGDEHGLTSGKAKAANRVVIFEEPEEAKFVVFAQIPPVEKSGFRLSTSRFQPLGWVGPIQKTAFVFREDGRGICSK